MAVKKQKNANKFTDQRAENWFNEFIAEVRKDELCLKTNIADKSKEDLYDNLIYGSPEAKLKDLRSISSRYFIEKMVREYWAKICEGEMKPIQIAFSLSSNKILVWAKVKDDDEETENALLITEAIMNSKYSDIGIHIASTIIEESDKLSVPSHFNKIHS